jgi:arsenite methyltransferase
MGVTIAVNEAAWAGAIVLFAGVALIAVFLRWWMHRRHLPIILAAIGFLLIAYAMFVSYSAITEFVGFATLCAGTLIDWRLWRAAKPN